jgi:hypothetical protein
MADKDRFSVMATRHSVTRTNCVYLEPSTTLIFTQSNNNCGLPIMRPKLVCLLLAALCNVAVTAPVGESTGLPVVEASPDTVGPPVNYYQLCCTRLCIDRSSQTCVVSMEFASGEQLTELLFQQTTSDCTSPIYSLVSLPSCSTFHDRILKHPCSAVDLISRSEVGGIGEEDCADGHS